MIVVSGRDELEIEGLEGCQVHFRERAAHENCKYPTGNLHALIGISFIHTDIASYKQLKIGPIIFEVNNYCYQPPINAGPMLEQQNCWFSRSYM